MNFSGLQKIQPLLNSIATLVVIGAGAGMLWLQFNPTAAAGGADSRTPKITGPLSMDGMELIGDKSARLVIVEYADFQCPACGKFAREVFPGLMSRYIKTGKVLFGFRNVPIPTHKNAARAAEAGVCAGKQGRFWETYDQLFALAPTLDETHWKEVATTNGLDHSQFVSCLDGQARAIVDRDLGEARKIGIRSTPTFVFGRISATGSLTVKATISGVSTAEEFYKVVETLSK